MNRHAWMTFSALLISSGVALVDCVGDEPATDAGAGADAATDSSTDGGSPAEGGGGDASTDPCGGSVNCPSQQAATHLQLWLRGDLGVDCTGGRVSTWHDQSGHHRDAVVANYPDGGTAFGPQCGGSTLNGRATVSFTASTGASAPFVDDILNVDLSFLVGQNYTIYVVHTPAAPSGQFAEGLLAAVWTYPTGTACITRPPTNDGTLDLFLATADDGGTVLEYNAHQVCHYAGIESDAWPYVPGNPTVSTFLFSGRHTIYADGIEVYSGTAEGDDTTPVLGDAGNLSPAVIGRESDDGLLSGVDDRYTGDIAEIIVWDTALGSEKARIDDYVKATWNLP